MNNKIHISSVLFLIAGLIMAVSAVVNDISTVMNYSETDQNMLLRIFMLPGLYILFSVLALFGRNRVQFGFLRFLLFFIFLGNLVHLGFSALVQWDVYTEIQNYLGPDIEKLYKVLDAAPSLGVHSFFSLAGWYPLYSPNRVFTPYIANAVSILILSSIFKRYISAYKKRIKAGQKETEETAAAMPEAKFVSTFADTQDTGDKDSDDLIERLYQKMMEEDKAAESNILQTSAVHTSSIQTREVQTQPKPSSAAPVVYDTDYAEYEMPTFEVAISKGASWVLCSESMSIFENNRYSHILSSATTETLGTGSIIVQEELNLYQGLRELNSLLPSNIRSITAGYLPFALPDGRNGVLLFAA